MIPEAVVEEVRSRVDIVAAIGRLVQLKKEGAAFGGSCPFHEEKTGSFKVFPDSKRFKCFGCGAAGDVFEFFRKLEAKPFPVILRALATSVGVDVPDRELTPAQKRAFGERAALHSAAAAAAEHWSANLWGPPGAQAREYLASRGLREDTLRSFRVGYAVADWHDLHKAIRARGGAVSDFQRAGLLVGSGDYLKTYDRFRDLFGADPVMNVNHSMNRENLYWGRHRLDGALARLLYDRTAGRHVFEGHIEDSPFFWGDVCRARTRHALLRHPARRAQCVGLREHRRARRQGNAETQETEQERAGDGVSDEKGETMA